MSKLGTASSTPAITVLGINTTARTALLRQGGNFFVAAQNLGWVPAHQNPTLPFAHQIDLSKAEKPDLARQMLVDLNNRAGQTVEELFRQGAFTLPDRSLSSAFPAHENLAEAASLPSKLVDALAKAMAQLPAPERSKRSLTLA